MEVQVQDSIDQFLLQIEEGETLKLSDAETCMEMFADYLVHYSDLFQDDEAEMDDVALAEWEAALESYVERLFDGDMEAAADLGALSLSALDAGHVRDFLGWYLLREPNMDSLALELFAGVLRRWIAFVDSKSWIAKEQSLLFTDILDDVVAEAARAAKAAHLLLYFVRLGGGVSPRLRGQRFDEFVEGHARIERMDEKLKQLWLGFDNQENVIGPVVLPAEMMLYLRIGDVLDVELGKRGGQWVIVDIGPVYPACVYVEADELKVPNKLT